MLEADERVRQGQPAAWQGDERVRQGQPVAWQGDERARQGDERPFQSDERVRQGDEHVRQGERAAWPADERARQVQPVAWQADEHLPQADACVQQGDSASARAIEGSPLAVELRPSLLWAICPLRPLRLCGFPSPRADRARRRAATAGMTRLRRAERPSRLTQRENTVR